MERDARRMRGERPVRVDEPEDRQSVPEVIEFVVKRGMLVSVLSQQFA